MPCGVVHSPPLNTVVTLEQEYYIKGSRILSELDWQYSSLSFLHSCMGPDYGTVYITFTAMPSSRQILSALAALAFTSVDAAMGPYFSTGPVASNSFIRESTATLVLPNAPSGSSGDLSLWVGMGTSNGDLIQSIAENWQSVDWSVYAYTLLQTGRPYIKCRWQISTMLT